MGQHSSVKVVSVGTGVTKLLPLRAEREQVVIYNAEGILYVKYGSDASEKSFTECLQSNQTTKIYKYTGPLTAVKSSGDSMVYVTECW